AFVAHCAQHVGPASAEWRAKQIGMLAYDICHRLAAIAQFATRTRQSLCDQQRMRFSMVANNVPLGGDAAGDRRFLADVTADEKEGRLHLVLGKNVQKVLSMRIVRPVIKSERELARIGTAGDGGAENL